MDASLKDRQNALQGVGESRLRKEDARFIQGKGNYFDDIKMPGMLYMDIVRAPVAHARIKKIHKEAALARHSRRVCGADRRRPEAAQTALDADPGRRCASRSGRYKSTLPDARSRHRHSR